MQTYKDYIAFVYFCFLYKISSILLLIGVVFCLIVWQVMYCTAALRLILARVLSY